MTSSPGPLCTGMDSPVRADSSTAERPWLTIPSTGTLAPGPTTTLSPTTTASAGISSSTPPRSTRAVRGRSPSRVRRASEARPLARASRYLPSRMRVMMAAPVSK